MGEIKSFCFSLLKFLPSGAKALIGLLFFFAIVDVPLHYSLRQAKLSYLETIVPYILLILIILIVALYFIINMFFKYSRNCIIRSLKSFSDMQVWSFFFFIVSLSYLYELIFYFRNINILGPASYFIGFTIVHIFLVIVGVICFILSKDKTFLRLVKGNFVYASAILSRNIVFKITIVVAYTLFLIYSIVFLLTTGINSTTTGTVETIYTESGYVIVRPTVRSFTHYTIAINDGKEIKKFRLMEKEWKKCNWEKVNRATIKHHIFWYSAGCNDVIECEP